ncbi:hypothetical protein F2Q68_00045802 [Brassica cretica]|uniref:Uncharacterized protein n=1 Tax=Brassica cretica TaxID=69181 RepID=A0A8S9LMD9_BRACR|nr:hypothetical protein F2Q68_00045802 [Brassica cretica]
MSSEVYYRSWMDKPHLDPNTNLLTEEYVQGIGEFMRLVQQQPDAKSGKPLRIFLERFQYHPADRVSNPRPLAVVCENPFSTAARPPEVSQNVVVPPADRVSNPLPLAVVCENPFSIAARPPEAPHPGKPLRIFLERFQYHPAVPEYRTGDLG